MRRYLTLPLVLALLGLALVLAPPAPARARALLVRSDPPDGAVVAVAPRALQLWFDHAALVEPDAVSLRDAAGQPVAVAEVRAESYRPDEAGLASDFDATYLFLCSLGLNRYPSLLRVALPPLGPGAYSLSWRTIALDDRRETSGSLVFVVDPAAPASLSAAAQVRSLSSMADDLIVSLAIRPNLPGANVLAVRAAAVRRPARAPIGAVRVRLTGPDGAAHEAAAREAPDGSFQLAGEQIDRPGRWTAEIHIDRGPLVETVAALAWEVAAPQRPPAERWPLPLIGGALGLCALIMRWAARRR